MQTRTPTRIAPARRCAYAVVRRVFEDGAYADQALHGQARELDARDHSLAMALAFGAVQRRATLDHLIEQLAGRPAAALDARVIAALRIGLYELLYMDGAPDYAVVADAVELSKSGARGGHGLVNAVLRRASREGAQALLSQFSDDTPEHAALLHSHPEWIARMWWSQLGPDGARALMRTGNEPGEVALRANALLTNASELAAALPVRTRRDELLEEALVLEEPFDEHASELYRQGAFIAQSRAAMLVSRALGPQPGERVLDLCAAPGGKTTHIAALMRGEGEVLAIERSTRRAGALSRTAQRMHAGSVRVEIADASEPLPGPAFDRVLVDPPCSGLGTLAARADLRWRVTPESIAEMVTVQGRILATGAAAVRSGGVLVYSTCTISPDENERLIASFLDSRTDFELDDLAAELPAYALAGGGGVVQTLPHRDHTAGFYIARMRRI